MEWEYYDDANAVANTRKDGVMTHGVDVLTHSNDVDVDKFLIFFYRRNYEPTHAGTGAILPRTSFAKWNVTDVIFYKRY